MVPVEVLLSDEGELSISAADQVVLLRHGVAFALEVCRLAVDREGPVAVRCVVATGDRYQCLAPVRLRTG